MDSQHSYPTRKRAMKLSTSVSLMVGAVIAAVLLIVHLFYFFQISHITRASVQDKALAVARTLADSPDVQRALLLPADRNIIQPVTLAVQQSNHLLFVVVTNMDGIRYSHPNKAAINRHFIGDDLQPALAGHENVSVNRGQLEPALRVFTPVYDQHQRQIGVVAVGISLSEVAQQIGRSRWSILWTVLFGVLAGAIGTYCLVRASRRVLSGLEPYEISMLFRQRQAMLQSLKEGVIAVDEQAQVTLINRTAQELLSDTVQAVNDAPGPLIDNLRQVVRSGTPLRDEEIHFAGRILISNTMPLRGKSGITGAVCTFRDKTEVSQLIQRLDGMVNYVDALRERSHEFMNKLHVILGLLHLKDYRQLESYILKTASNYQAEIGSLMAKIKSPVIAGFLLSKMSHAADRGHQLTISNDSLLPDSGSEEQTATLITVLGNLIENALDAADDEAEGEISVLLHYQNGWLACVVSDDGPGIPPDRLEAIFAKGVSTKGENRGVGLFLAKQQTESLGGKIIVESEPGVYTQFFVQLPWDRGSKSA